MTDQADPLKLQRKGTLEEILDELDRPFQVVGNTLAGRPGAALRQAGDLVLGPLSAVTGGAIPELTSPEDKITGGEILGMHGHGLGKTVADVAIGAALNPMTYLTHGRTPVGKQLAKTKVRSTARGDNPEQAQEATRLALESALTHEGRQHLKQHGSSFLGDLAASNDPAELARQLEHDPRFEQGGFRFRIPGTNVGTGTFLAGHETDPLSLLRKGGTAAGNLIDKAAAHVGLEDPVKRTVAYGRAALGYRDLDPAERSILDKAAATGHGVAQANEREVQKIWQSLPEDEAKLAGDIFQNLKRDPATGRPIDLIGRGTSLEQRVDQYVTDPAARVRIKQAVLAQDALNKQQIEEGIHRGFSKPGVGHESYMPRMFTGMRKPSLHAEDFDAFGNIKSINKSRKLETDDDLLQFLTEHPEYDIERDARKAFLTRAAQQGRAAQNAELGRRLIGSEYTVADPAMKNQLNQILSDVAVASPEFAQAASQAANGMPARKLPMQLLATMNRYFKPAAVYGVAIPKIGSIISNKISGIPQALSQPETAPHALRGLASDFTGAAAEGINGAFGTKLPTGALGNAFAEADHALSQAGGLFEQQLKTVSPELREALENGVMDGFVPTERILAEMKRQVQSDAPWWQVWKNQKAVNVWNMPGVMFQGLESRMRYGLFLSLRADGYSPVKAAQAVKDAFLDYSVTGSANRTLRDVIPFAAFLAGTAAQHADWLSRTPAAGTIMAPLYGQREGAPVYPYIANQANVPLGNDTEGNPVYAAGLRLPIEQLNAIPSSWRSVEQTIVGSSHPLIKSAYAEIAGHDPFFGTPTGSYDKTPEVLQALGMPQHSELGRVLNTLSGTGVIQPLESGLGTVDKLLDTRQTAGQKALDLLTGAKVVSVDEQRALQQLLTEALSQNPNVRQVRDFYEVDKANPNSDEAAILDELRKVKADIKHKREAANGPAHP